MKNKKSLLIIGIVVALFVGGYYIYSALNQPKEEKITLQKASKKKVVKETITKSTKPKEAVEEARSTLENRTKANEQEYQDVSKALTAGLDVLSKTKIGEDVKNDYNSHLQNSSQDLLKITVLMFNAGYKFKDGSLEVYKSDSDTVNQFVFSMSKDGQKDISFAGNYVQGTQQIEIANQHGNPPDLASPSNSPQSK